MQRMFLAVCLVVASIGSASADVIYDVQFSSPVYSTTVGGSSVVGLTLRETLTGASTTNFGNFSAMAFRFNFANPTVANPVVYTPGAGTNIFNQTPGANFIDVFVDSIAFAGVAPTVVNPSLRTISLGSFQVTGASAGVSGLSVTAAPDAYTNLVLGGPEDLFFVGGPTSDLNFQALPPGTSFNSTSATFSAVPEPSSLALLSLSVCGLALRRKKHTLA